MESQCTLDIYEPGIIDYLVGRQANGIING